MKFQSLMRISTIIATCMIAMFLALVLGLSIGRHVDREWNYPMYQSLQEYKEAGGSTINYYLGYQLLEGYDTPNDDTYGDEGYSDRRQTGNTLYTCGIVLGIILIMLRLRAALRSKIYMIDLFLWFILMVLALQFGQYLIHLLVKGWV